MIDNNTDMLKYGYINKDGIYIHTSFDKNIPSIAHAIYGVNITKLGNCNIGIIDTDKNIPRFHIFTENNDNIIIRLDIADYYSKKYNLNIEQKNDINNIMNMNSIFKDLSVYSDLCSLWNDYNDTEIAFIQPDYMKLE